MARVSSGDLAVSIGCACLLHVADRSTPAVPGRHAPGTAGGPDQRAVPLHSSGRAPAHPHPVVEYGQRPVKSIRGGLQLVAGGAILHTLRHMASSLLAELGEPEAIPKEMMGDCNLTTTQRHDHVDNVQAGQVQPVLVDLRGSPRLRNT